MGRKGKDKKKGKGAEKTAVKTDKKLSAKQKKELAKIGEEDIESVIAELEKEDKKRNQVVESVVDCPSRRINFAFVPHPTKEELILFGGEFFNGQKTFVYNDLLFYSITKRQWSVVKAPGGPPPRCGHQMVSVPSNRGQLWLFGGEFASPTQSQFYHYRDLWLYHLEDRRWEKVPAAGGPSARSGHRMVHSKKRLVVFGGFHDNLRDYKYFNDVHVFDTEAYEWRRLEPTGTPPAPRSGCCMVALQDGRILVGGGYSKERVKKDVDKGHVYADLFLLTPEKNDTTGTKWKWVTVKPGGVRFSPRCGMTICPTSNLCGAYCFGGVFDVEENEEEISGKFYNDFFHLDLEKPAWNTVTLRGKKVPVEKAKKGEGNEEAVPKEDAPGDKEQDMEIQTVSDDGVFTVTIGPAPAAAVKTEKGEVAASKLFAPSPRMNCGLAMKHGVLYLYGGMFEDGDRQITLNDFYCLDTHKLDEWKILMGENSTGHEWVDSGSSSESGSEEEESGEDEDDEDDEEESPMETE